MASDGIRHFGESDGPGAPWWLWWMQLQKWASQWYMKGPKSKRVLVPRVLLYAVLAPLRVRMVTSTWVSARVPVLSLSAMWELAAV